MSYMQAGQMGDIGGLKKALKKGLKKIKKKGLSIVGGAVGTVVGGPAGAAVGAKLGQSLSKKKKKKKAVAAVSQQAQDIAPKISPAAAAQVMPSVQYGSSGANAEIASAASAAGIDPIAMLSAVRQQAASAEPSEGFMPGEQDIAPGAPPAAAGGDSKMPLVLGGLALLGLFLFGRKKSRG